MKALYVDNRLDKILALKATSRINRMAALGPLSPLRYAKVPEPDLPGPNWLKVRNISCGLCGTDIHLVFMDMDPKCFPAALPGLPRIYLGHEVVGEVTQVGAGVDTVSPGDRVALRVDWPSCFQMELMPPCRQCADGSYMLCERLGVKELPRDTGGGFSPWMVLHKSQPFVVPAQLGLEDALLIEPTAVAVHSVNRAELKASDRILVIGAGTIGLLLVAVLRRKFPDAIIECLARHPYQQALAERMGATVVSSEGNLYARIAQRTGARHIRGYLGNEILLGGYDVIFDSVGNDRTLQDGLRWVKGGGQLVLVGINFAPGKIDYTPIWNQEISVLGVNSHGTEADGRDSFEYAAELLLKGLVTPADFITHRFPMKHYKKAIKTFLDKKQSRAVKIVLDHA